MEYISAQRYCIGLLGEEASEIAVEASRGARFGYDTPASVSPPESVVEAITRECGDVLAAIEFACRHKVLDRNNVIEAARTKLRKLLDPDRRDYIDRRLAPEPPTHEAYTLWGDYK